MKFKNLWIASIFSLINTIVESKIFNAYVMIPLYSVAVISLILYLVIYKKANYIKVKREIKKFENRWNERSFRFIKKI